MIDRASEEYSEFNMMVGGPLVSETCCSILEIMLLLILAAQSMKFRGEPVEFEFRGQRTRRNLDVLFWHDAR